MQIRIRWAAIVLVAAIGLGPWQSGPAVAQVVPIDPAPRAEATFRLGLLGPAWGTPEADTLAVKSASRLGVDAVVVFEPTANSGVIVCDVPGVSRIGGAAVVRWSVSDKPGAGHGAFSRQDLDGLTEAISRAEAGAVLVAVDHAWWAASADPEAWDAAHAVLAASPRVRAVIAVGDGVARDDGERDGIRYLGLPPRSGMGPRGLDRFARPAVVLATGGPDGVTFSMIEPDAVRGVESWLGSEADDAIALRGAVESRGSFAAFSQGGPAGTVTLTLTNPTTQAVRYALGIDGPEGWVFSREEVSGTIAEGASEKIEIAAESPTLKQRPTVEVRGQLRLPLTSGGEQAVPVSIEIPVRPEVSLADAGPTDSGAALRLDSRSGVIVDTADLPSPFTIECWVHADEVTGEQVLLSAAGLELIWADAAGLTPSPSLVLTGAADEPVRTASAEWGDDGCPKGAGLIERWVHVAACLRADSATLFVDGVPVGTRALPEGFTLRGPLVIGGIADEYARVRGGLSGLIDEVRVSTVVRYDGPFTPSRGFASDEQTALLLHFDRAMGPVFADDSPTRSHGWGVGGAGRARVEAAAPSP